MFLRLQSYYFGNSGPHANFQNRSLSPCGLFWVSDDDDEQVVDNKGFLSHR